MKTLLTRHEVAQLLQASPRTIARLRSAGELKATKVRSVVRFHADDVQAFLDAQRRWARLQAGSV